MEKLEILFQDSNLVAINKPPGLLVHKSAIAADVKVFAVQMLRDQIGQVVWPIHRLDRKTSGVLLFAKNESINSLVSKQFANGMVSKKYLAIVRGHTPEQQIIDYPLRKDNGTLQDAITHFKTLQHTQIPFVLEKHDTQRYSLVEVTPQTGRMHQIRKHFAHIFHPIIGDRPHGCNKQNRFFKYHLGFEEMLLHASSLSFEHPETKLETTIKADLPPGFRQMLIQLGFDINAIAW